MLFNLRIDESRNIMLGKIKKPQTKNKTNQNTSCAALENLIKSKSTFKSVTLASADRMFTSVTTWTTSEGCAAFSKSLCPHVHVWCTELCGKCPCSSRSFSLYDCPSLH